MARTATDKTAANSRGLNVDPISSVLPIITRDVDASGYTTKPLDGQFLNYQGRGKATTAQPSGLDPFDEPGDPAGTMRMVWGHANRADRTGSGNNRTPVILSKVIIKLSLYNFKDGQAILPGDLVCLDVNKEAASGGGANVRYVADIFSRSDMILGAADAWVVGVVLEGTGGAPISTATGSATPITIELYESPQFMKNT